jgi:EAL domain-containing protein (putative c-di-GMP-specific phosphodiesterase class I)
MPQIIVERAEGSLIDRFRSYKVVIDGEFRGMIRPKECWSFAVDPGTHTVTFHIDYYRSPALRLVVFNRTRVVCRSSAAHAFGMLNYITTNSWITVIEEDDVSTFETPHPKEVDQDEAVQPARPGRFFGQPKPEPKTKLHGSLRLSHPKMTEAAKARRLVELDLRDAVATNALELRYEPQIDLLTRRITGFEALLRWRHPVHGKMPAADFVPLAEKLGLGPAIARHVVQTACREAARWSPAVRVSINLSASQLDDDSLLPIVAATLVAEKVDPSRLVIEVEESVITNGTAANLATLHALREAGIGIAINDFKHGFDLAYGAGERAFNRVKLSPKLISDLGDAADRRAAVHSALRLCEAANIPCCAVGVETKEDLAILLADNCLEAQGRVFGPVLAPRDIPDALGRMNPIEPGNAMIEAA